MTTEMWLAYTSTLLVFMISPGPSHMLMLSNSLTNGPRRAMATAAGDLSANVLQMLIVAVGLSGLAVTSEAVFVWIKWLGVGYLMIMAVMTMRRQRDELFVNGISAVSARTLYLQGFVTSASNPKAIVFFAALFPQFINTDAAAGPQFLILGATFLVVDAAFLGFYAAFAAWLADVFRHRIGRHINVISGVLLMIAALLLGLRGIRAGA